MPAAPQNGVVWLWRTFFGDIFHVTNGYSHQIQDQCRATMCFWCLHKADCDMRYALILSRNSWSPEDETYIWGFSSCANHNLCHSFYLSSLFIYWMDCHKIWYRSSCSPEDELYLLLWPLNFSYNTLIMLTQYFGLWLNIYKTNNIPISVIDIVLCL